MDQNELKVLRLDASSIIDILLFGDIKALNL